jgi:hypothetical protein
MIGSEDKALRICRGSDVDNGLGLFISWTGEALSFNNETISPFTDRVKRGSISFNSGYASASVYVSYNRTIVNVYTTIQISSSGISNRLIGTITPAPKFFKPDGTATVGIAYIMMYCDVAGYSPSVLKCFINE